MSFRKHLLLLVMSALITWPLVITACRPAPSPTPLPPTPTTQVAPTPAPTATATPSPVKLVVWTTLFEAAQQAFDKVSRQYTIEHPHVTIESHRVEELKDKLRIAVPAGEGPAIFTFAHDWIGEMADLNIIVPLDNYITPEFRAAFPTSAWDAVTYKGHIYAIPESAETVIMIYNKDLISKPPTSTEELIGVMKQFYKPDEGKYGLAWPIDPYHVSAFIHGFGGFYLNDETGEVGLDRPEHIQGLQWILDNIRPYMSSDKDYATQIALFTDRNAPILFTGPWALPDVEKAGINFGVAPLPEITGIGPARPFMGVRSWMVTTNAQDVAAAVDFLTWFVSPPQIVDWVVEAGFAPAFTAAYEDARIAEDEVKLTILAQAQAAIPMPKRAEMGLIWAWGAPYWDVLDAVWTGEKTAEVALKEGQQAVLDAIAKTR
ncbi:MAG: extracellular solute-binding protein [Chloroflexi bacterium]|nr:extracellular solute-binding protein [Chloroflexota bacterium]